MPEQPVNAPQASPAVPIDWSAVRVLAVAVGVREAARQCGISEEATMKRCQREGWLKNDQVRAVAQRSMQERRGLDLSANVRMISPAQAMAQELMVLGARTKVGIARGLAKAGQHIETMDGQEILADSQNVKAVAQSASLVHGWQNQSPTPKIRLELLGDKREQSITLEVESEVVSDQDWDK